MVRFLILVIAWLLISGFLGVVTLNSPRGIFVLQEIFPHLSINHHVNLIFAAFSLFGDLLVPPRFACINTSGVEKALCTNHQQPKEQLPL